jgi:predicted dehydrogenase
MQTAAVAAAGMAAPRAAFGGELASRGGAGKDDLHIALVGAGVQGLILMRNCLRIPGLRFKAICDIWGYSRRYAAGTCKAFKQPVNVYVDYREMLAEEEDLDAVIVATPDWMHAEHAIACLRAGKHVYCEKEMSNTLDGCRSMVRAAKETGKLLQIGHQRRSNPRYLHAEKFLHKDKVLGRITHCYGQWNRGPGHNRVRTVPEKHHTDGATLKKYGYDTMLRFLNWRWFREFSGGPIADLGSHQVDIFNWFLRGRPDAVVASGGRDYYKDREWYDNVTAIYEYETAQGKARGLYQVLNTTSHGGYHEVFMGDKGSLEISEDVRVGFFYPERQAKSKKWVDQTAGIEGKDRKTIEMSISRSKLPDGTKSRKTVKAEADARKPVHMPHLENFFEAMRTGVRLTCPAEGAFATAVPILRTNDAVATGRRIVLTPADYAV